MKFKAILVHVALIVSFSAGPLISNTGAQGICIAPKLKVGQMMGQVVFSGGKGNEPIDGAVIEITEDRNDARPFQRAKTDSTGHFAFQNIKPGKYKLIASAPQMHTLVVNVQITPSVRIHQRYILIALGAKPLEPCGGGFARVEQSKH